MAGLDGDAATLEVRCVLRVGVAAGHTNPAKGEQLGEGTHSGSGDANEVDGPRVGWIEEAGHYAGAI